jgi:hypothetical protein
MHAFNNSKLLLSCDDVEDKNEGEKDKDKKHV